ncbi:AAA family ATPase [Natranaerobius thermophilus]|uniref:AAA ATPase n=1 Tax=Natranaerobius thermophilus (strain ATCC BAA-1301 / DSM 18059 / JW/NM-WN-LF) TaxID=457570 RepID=B2A6L8_NATTJ|nr:ATP-binding protein [Natranaerobius thermophilus]ACB85551.1 AAA ATPase [Natranaerobius thermophilus JW/NM-WN-LF]
MSKTSETILNAPIEKRIKYFEDYTTSHATLIDVYQKLELTINYPSNIPLVFMIGPTGVGKTTLRHKIEGEILKEESSNMENDPGIIPILGVEAIASDQGGFDWKDFYYRGLVELEEPLVDYKTDVTHGKESKKLNTNLNSKSNKATYRRAFEKALHYRQVKVLIIDEAQHLTKLGSGRKLIDQLDTIKSLANKTHALPVLIGTYELLHFLNLNGQLSRRSQIIHFHRYLAYDENQKYLFIKAIKSFQNKLPLERTPNLEDKFELLYKYSLGCIGVLKNWLTRALIKAINNNDNTITAEILEKTALTIAQCEQIAAEIIEGEKQIIQYNNDSGKLEEMLGLNIEKVESENEQESQQNQNVKGNKKPGERSPGRDTVGRDNFDL